MRRQYLIALLLLLSVPVSAEMEKIATTCESGICLHWWPILPNVKGWHHDRDASLWHSFNAQAPDGKTFKDADSVIYASGIYKPRVSEVKTLETLIENDHKRFYDTNPGITIKPAESVTTSDGQVLKTFAFFPKENGNWEHVAYGEEGEYYLVFTLTSRSQDGYSQTLAAYKQFLQNYKAKP